MRNGTFEDFLLPLTLRVGWEIIFLLSFGIFFGQVLESLEGRRLVSSVQMFPIFCQSVISTLFEFHNGANTASR